MQIRQHNCLGNIIYSIEGHNCTVTLQHSQLQWNTVREIFQNQHQRLGEFFFFINECLSEWVQVIYLESLCFPSGPHNEDSPACSKSAACKWSGGHACGPTGCCPLDLRTPPNPRTKGQRTVSLFFPPSRTKAADTHTVRWQRPDPSPPGVPCAAEEAQTGSVWWQLDRSCEWWAGCSSTQRVATLYGEHTLLCLLITLNTALCMHIKLHLNPRRPHLWTKVAFFFSSRKKMLSWLFHLMTKSSLYSLPVNPQDLWSGSTGGPHWRRWWGLGSSPQSELQTHQKKVKQIIINDNSNAVLRFLPGWTFSRASHSCLAFSSSTFSSEGMN